MPELPSTDDTLLQFLGWLGIPTFLLIPLAIFFFALDWYEKGKMVVGSARRGADTIRERTPPSVLAFLTILLLMGSCVAISYSIATLIEFMLADSAGDRSLVEQHETLTEILVQLWQYDNWTEVTKSTVATVVLILILIAGAFILDAEPLQWLLKNFGKLLFAASGVVGVLFAIGSCAAVSLHFTEDEELQGIAWVNIVFAALLLLAPIVGGATWTACRNIFGNPEQDW